MSLDIILNSEIVSPDILNLFFSTLAAAVITGAVFGILIRATWTLWY